MSPTIASAGFMLARRGVGGSPVQRSLSDSEDWVAAGDGTGGASPATQLRSAALAHPKPDVGDAWDLIDQQHGVHR